jgi:hypothetical protein
MSLFSVTTYAQKGIEKLTEAKIDSLQKAHIDTILWYCSYCGECFFKKTDAPIKYYNCQMQSGYDLSYNAIIYKQLGKYYVLNFDCTNFVVKRQLDSCKSIPYFISIKTTLDRRDRTIKAMEKKGVPFTSQMDGGFEDARLYLGEAVRYIGVADELDRNKSKRQKGDYWPDKEIVLVDLISLDVASKNGKKSPN